MRPSSAGRYLRKLVTGAAAVLLVSGVGLIGVSLASQKEAPQVPLSIDISDLAPEPVLGDSGGDDLGGYFNLQSAAERTASEAQLIATIGASAPSDKFPSRVITPTLPRSEPATLDIPAIDVHSVVQQVGQTADGALEVPAPGPHYDEAAWYRHSPTPGELGPSVLLGHIDSAANGPSVFFDLGKLLPGDRISVTRADDSVATFIVDKVARYSKNDFPTNLVYGDIDHAGLRILTCGGAFDNSTGHYLDNIVVFASLLDPSKG
ncbi:MAG: class F sortase [Actinomycetota bacterium]